MNKSTIKIKTGDKIGELLVIKDLKVDQSHHHYYICQCTKCGRTEKVSRERLIKSSNPQCKFCGKHYNDFRGKKIRGIEVIEETPRRNARRSIIWECKCVSCGRAYYVSAENLIKKSVPKCNCGLRRYYETIEDEFLSQIF